MEERDLRSVGKEIGISAEYVKLLVDVALGYIGTEGSLDLVSIFRSIFKDKIEKPTLPPGN